jgi:hypothetical protein
MGFPGVDDPELLAGGGAVGAGEMWSLSQSLSLPPYLLPGALYVCFPSSPPKFPS